MARVHYLVNPAGHGGAGLAAWNEFESLWPDAIDPADVTITEYAGHAGEIAATLDGDDTAVAVGGDGTVNEILTALIDHPEPRPRLAIIPGGTGNDIAREVGIESVADAVAALRSDHDHAFDVVRADWEDPEGPGHRYAFLQVAVGFSASKSVRPWMKRLLGPSIAYYLSTLIQIVVFRAPIMDVEVDGQPRRGPTWVVVVGNTEWTSGCSMRLSPGAKSDDGELNVSVIRFQTSKLKTVLRMLPKVPTGEHIREPGVAYLSGRRVQVESDPPSVLDLDGELAGHTPATFEVCPGAVRILTLVGV